MATSTQDIVPASKQISKISASASQLLAFLQRHTQQDGLAIYSKRELAVLLGTSEKTVTRSVQTLLREQAISVVARFDEDGAQLANAYRVEQNFDYDIEPRGRKVTNKK